MKKIILALAYLAVFAARVCADQGFVATIDMRMLILPGTAAHLAESIDRAAADGAKAIVVNIDTPGGILTTSQEMIQTIFQSPIPVIVYVSETGSTATSAGVFITLAGHVAAMAPGSSMGAAHPVAQDGKDIEGDMRKKAENATAAMVKAIADQRGRNTLWAEKAVKESVSVTAKEALELGVIDYVAPDLSSLLKQVKGKEVTLRSSKVKLDDLSQLPRQVYQISVKNQAINFISHPNVAALLWLVATTAISIELYNPGAILPGVVGVISLILALAVNQIIPMSQGAMLLLIAGAILIGIDLFVSSIVLGVGGVIAIVLGALYLVDTGEAPGLAVSASFILPIAAVLGGFLFVVAATGARALRRAPKTGKEGLVGEQGRALENFAERGTIMVAGEVWKAVSESGLVSKGETVIVDKVLDGLVLSVRKKA